jgi:hypothetical protein
MMASLRRSILLASLLALAACRRGHAPPPPTGVVPQTPVTSTFPALPTPAESTQVFASPVLGTAGDLSIATTHAHTIVGVRDTDGSFRPHAPIAVASVGRVGAAWLLVLAESGLFLVEGDGLALRARLFANASGDVASSPDGAMFAFGACEPAPDGGKERCGVDVRAFPDLRRLRFVETDDPSRIRWASDGSELAIASRANASVTVVGIASGALERFGSTAAVNDAAFVGKDAVAYGDDDDTTRVVERPGGRVLLDHLARIAHQVRRDQNAVAYDAARDVLYTGGNDNDVWVYPGPRTGAPTAKRAPLVELANDVSDFALLPNGDLIVALDSGSLDLVHPSGTVDHLLGASIGSVSYGARIALGRDGDVVGVLGHTVFRWKVGERTVHQAALFGSYETVSPLRDAPGYVRIFDSDAIAWVPSGGDPLNVTLMDLGKEPGDCKAVHDGLVCFRDEPQPVLRGAPRGKPFADLVLPARVTGPFRTFTVVDGMGIAIDSALRAIEIDASGARSFARLPRGARPTGTLARDAKTGTWTIDGKPLVALAPEVTDASARD